MKRIDIHNEHLITFAVASQVFPTIEGLVQKINGEQRRGPHASSFWRWARKGLRGVKLEYVRIGHRIVTSREALDRFANALAAADELPSQPKLAYEPPSNELSASRRAEIRRADEILTRDGILPPKN